MKKIFSFFIAVIFMAFSLTGCGNADKNKVNTVSKIVVKDGVTYVEVEGKPFIYSGIQLRTDAFMNCEYKTAEQLDEYFRLASLLNVNTVQIPLDWNDIEKDFDEYDYSVPDAFLTSAEKYGLKVEFLWFSTNMCGETHSYHVPDYIIDDPVTYPRYQTDYTGQFWPYYGYIMHLEFGNDNLLVREVKVVKNLMNFINERNERKGRLNTLIGVQIHNEPDCFPLWRVGHNQISVLKNGVQITEAEARAEVNKALDTVGKAFKSTDYKIYTRVNFALANTMNDYIESVFALDGIDIVGDDPHENNTATIRQAIEEYSLVGNYPHIAENRANTDNNESLILTAFANGGGYIMYEVVTSEYFIRNNSSSIDPDYGIYKTDLTKRSFTDKTAKFLKMLNNSGYATVAAGKDKFHAFNVENNYPSGNYESTVSIAGRRIKFSTGDAALGYIIEYDGALIIASDKTAQISGLQDISKVEEGEYKDGTWVKTKDVEVIKGFVNTGDYKIYRVLL